MAQDSNQPGIGGRESGVDLAGRQIGSYQILSLLGVGGMGEVYRARDLKLGREVAIKVLPALFSADPERLRRFEREARLLAALNHPHIATIYELEHFNGVPALVMELVEGPTLADRLQSVASGFPGLSGVEGSRAPLLVARQPVSGIFLQRKAMEDRSSRRVSAGDLRCPLFG